MLEWRSKTLDACLMGHTPLIARSIIRPSQLFGLDEAAALFRPHKEQYLVAFKRASKEALLTSPYWRLEAEFLAEYGSLSTVV